MNCGFCHNIGVVVSSKTFTTAGIMYRETITKLCPNCRPVLDNSIISRVTKEIQK